MDFSNNLILWYLENKRDLPWRHTVNPYPIWLSEIILQQTRVAQGLPYYYAFITTFPTIYDLANADEEQVLKLWQGLGYYSRARNLHFAAKFIANDLKGEFPKNFEDLKKLKGVGDYTAAAIASFAYNEAVPVVDGNVFRVMSRFFGIDLDISLSTTKKEFFNRGLELIPNGKSSVYNQAIMEFGALQCVPQNPDCTICPLAKQCRAFALGKVNLFPVKTKKLKITNRYITYLLVYDVNGNSLVQKRTAKGIWHNLYELPNIETDKSLASVEISKLIKEKLNGISKLTEIKSAEVIHKLSHQHLHISFWKVNLDVKLEEALPFNEIMKLPFPIVLHNFLEAHY